MKIVILLLVIATSPGFSQIPNGDFENWATDGPVSWASPNAPDLPQLVTKSTTASSGSFAAKGEVVQWSPGLVVAPFLQTGDDASGFPYTHRPVKFTGSYIFSPVDGDRFTVSVLLLKNGEAVGIAARTYSNASPNYAPIEIPFSYLNDDTPDTCVVTIALIGPATGADYHLGSYYIVDDLKLSDAPVSVEEEVAVPSAFSLKQNFPNPFNPETVIRYSVPFGVAGNVTLTVYNSLGQAVATLVDGQKEAGEHQVSFNAADLPSGTYIYRISSGNFTETRKMILIK